MKVNRVKEPWTAFEVDCARRDAANLIWDVFYNGGCVSVYRLRNKVCVSLIRDVRNSSDIKTAHAEPHEDDYNYWVGLDVAIRKALRLPVPAYILEKNARS